MENKNKEIYVLRVVENEDDYLYMTLGFENKQDLLNAKGVIEKFDEDWYDWNDGLCEENSKYSGDYYSDLVNELEEKGIKQLSLKVYSESVGVR